MQTAKNTVAPKLNQPMKSERVTHRGWIALLILRAGDRFSAKYIKLSNLLEQRALLDFSGE